MPDFELTLLSFEEWMKTKIDSNALVTDLAIITGCELTSESNPNEPRTGVIFTKSFYPGLIGNVFSTLVQLNAGNRWLREHDSCTGAIRPVIKSEEIYSKIISQKKLNSDGLYEVELGEYPQMVVSEDDERDLNILWEAGVLKKIGQYTFELHTPLFGQILPKSCLEYSDDGRKFVEIVGNIDWRNGGVKLSNGDKNMIGIRRWLEVTPVKWLVDEENHMLIAKNSLLSGVTFDTKKYDGNFEETHLYKYMNEHMKKEMFKNATLLENIQGQNETLKMCNNINIYGIKTAELSEKEKIQGLLDCDIPVFLHGKSSDGKSARVKQIDPNCVILYLRNATPDSINGKSVYNQETNEMIDIKPTWLVKLETLCAKEPDKIHILFLDELTNALPSIQGMAFNIVLDREVNGLWKLPSNARIVAAGNELSDSLAANELAEPLFNRFAHIYIETDLDNWLKWAIDNDIHPLIYMYNLYKKGGALRTKYNGLKPNADPRKWEMASKVLYASGNVQTLKTLIGEDVTKELAEFAKQSVITLDDVLNGNYVEYTLHTLSAKQRYATIASLLQVDEQNVSKVREFVEKLNAHTSSTFDILWAKNDEKRLEILAEIMLKQNNIEPEVKVVDEKLLKF